mgnify:CR=1 FL=1
MWEMRQVSVEGTVTFFSWYDGWGSLPSRDYLARFHPEWTLRASDQTSPGEVVVELLKQGWEPYATEPGVFHFRRQVNP